jgi:hypothetical protein
MDLCSFFSYSSCKVVAEGKEESSASRRMENAEQPAPDRYKQVAVCCAIKKLALPLNCIARKSTWIDDI